MLPCSAEKAFKAVILYIKKMPHRSHDLLEIYEEVKGFINLEQNLEESLPELSAYYTQSRYPNAGLRRPSAEISRPRGAYT